MFQPVRDCLLLRLQTLGREHGVGLRIGLLAESVQETGELAVAFAALSALLQVIDHRRIGQLTASLGEIAVDQAVFLDVMRVSGHGWPPSNPRSLRAARNRWTRTVDSFKPVIALTSRGV